MARHWSGVADGARRRVAGSKWGQPRLLVELVLGMALIVGGAVGVALWQRHATQSKPVVVAARDLARGHTVVAGDLALATITGARGVQVMPAADAGQLLGATLVVDLMAATPLAPHLVEHRREPAAGEALVSVALRPGEAPPDVTALDQVRVLTVRLDPLNAVPPAVTFDQGEVWAVQHPTDLDPTTIVTLRAGAEVLERITLADRVRLGVIRS